MEITLYTAIVCYFNNTTQEDVVAVIEANTKFGVLRAYLAEIVPLLKKPDTARIVYTREIANSISVRVVKFPRITYND